MTEQRRGWDPVMPGWYPDPTDRRQQRFWDGSQWTQQVKRIKTSGRTRLLIIGGLAALLVGLVFLVLWVRVEDRNPRSRLEKTLAEVSLQQNATHINQQRRRTVLSISALLSAAPCLLRELDLKGAQTRT